MLAATPRVRPRSRPPARDPTDRDRGRSSAPRRFIAAALSPRGFWPCRAVRVRASAALRAAAAPTTAAARPTGRTRGGRRGAGRGALRREGAGGAPLKAPLPPGSPGCAGCWRPAPVCGHRGWSLEGERRWSRGRERGGSCGGSQIRLHLHLFPNPRPHPHLHPRSHPISIPFSPHNPLPHHPICPPPTPSPVVPCRPCLGGGSCAALGPPCSDALRRGRGGGCECGDPPTALGTGPPLTLCPRSRVHGVGQQRLRAGDTHGWLQGNDLGGRGGQGTAGPLQELCAPPGSDCGGGTSPGSSAARGGGRRGTGGT